MVALDLQVPMPATVVEVLRCTPEKERGSSFSGFRLVAENDGTTAAPGRTAAPTDPNGATGSGTAPNTEKMADPDTSTGKPRSKKSKHRHDKGAGGAGGSGSTDNGTGGGGPSPANH
ncbi:MAG: hypothetical protein QOI66_280 [Myxococcales bacterium]|jgi:hypothetical protein|nr:hypothetical protein [Myxococcales bacterium]